MRQLWSTGTNWDHKNEANSSFGELGTLSNSQRDPWGETPSKMEVSNSKYHHLEPTFLHSQIQVNPLYKHYYKHYIHLLLMGAV